VNLSKITLQFVPVETAALERASTWRRDEIQEWNPGKRDTKCNDWDNDSNDVIRHGAFLRTIPNESKASRLDYVYWFGGQN